MKIQKVLFAIFVGVGSVFVALSVYGERVDLFTLFIYLVSIFFSLFIFDINFFTDLFKKLRIPSHKDLLPLLVVVIAQLILYFSSFPFHYIQDEFITAHVAFNLPPLEKINWFAAFPDKNEWVVQFPVIFYAMHKFVLMLLGPSLQSLRVAVWPYQILVIIYLYLLSKEYFQKRLFQIITVLIFIFLAPNIYLSSLGVPFVSSTFFFLASFYHFSRMLKENEVKQSLASGFFAALGYLTYQSSYITIPILLMFLGIDLFFKKSLKSLQLLVPFFLMFFVTIAPFLTFALTKNNFFMQRVDQVNFFWGSWGNTQQSIQTGESLLILLKNQIVRNIQSLYTNGIGGVNDYWFGKLPLFNAPTLLLLLIGSLISLYQGIMLKLRIYLYPSIICLIVFFFGMVLTVPPGAFHRTSLSFPLIAIILTVPINYLLRANLLNKKMFFLITFTIVAIFSITNLNSIKMMIKNDESISQLTDSIYIASFIERESIKEQTIFISAFPNYHLGKELLFRTSNSYKFVTNYLPNIIPLINKSPIILLYPDKNQIKELYNNFPNGTIIDTVNGVKLKNHIIFIPN